MKFQRFWAAVLALVMAVGMAVPAAAASPEDALAATAKVIQKTVPDPQVGSIGGEWAIIGLARGGYAVPSGYYANVLDYVRACGGVLHSRKYTEYSRVILALTAIGKDPTDVGGYDLTAPLEDFDKTVWQGINGPIWALIALDSGNYTCAVRQKYIDHILSKELAGGGWALSGTKADADITGMALQALAKYQDQPAVKAATARALTRLSKMQNTDGGYATMDEDNCESTVQVLVALCELGIDLQDERFVKNGNTVMDGLLEYYVSGGGFSHVKNGGSGNDGMSTEQGFYALVAAARAESGQSSLYRMKTDGEEAVTFVDITGHRNRKAIEALAAQGIINGMDRTHFAPDKTMTRAEFCTITVRALGLTPAVNDGFTDVKAGDWFAGYVGAAYAAGIVNGVGGGRFDPNGTITRQEAAVMVARAANVMGMDTAAGDADEVLLLFGDGRQVASWARDAVAWCYLSEVLEEQGEIRPAQSILRGEIAQMIYNLLAQTGKR